MGVTIISDSTCDLAPAQARDLGVEIVPIWIVFGQERLRDGIDITRQTFNQRLASSKDLPRTEPPDVSAFESAFAKHVEAGNEVVAIVVSSLLSKTYAAASEAASKFGPSVRVFDTLTLSGGVLLHAAVASELARGGARASDVVATLERGRGAQHGYMIAPDLSYLGRSGRINKAIVALGTVLKVNPVLQVKGGLVETAAQTRTFEKAQDLLVDVAARNATDVTKTRFAVGHVNAPKLAAKIAAALETKIGLPAKSFTIYEGGPTISVNGGPGSAAVFFMAGV